MNNHTENVLPMKIWLVEDQPCHLPTFPRPLQASLRHQPTIWLETVAASPARACPTLHIGTPQPPAVCYALGPAISRLDIFPASMLYRHTLDVTYPCALCFCMDYLCLRTAGRGNHNPHRGAKPWYTRVLPIPSVLARVIRSR